MALWSKLVAIIVVVTLTVSWSNALLGVYGQRQGCIVIYQNVPGPPDFVKFQIDKQCGQTPNVQWLFKSTAVTQTSWNELYLSQGVNSDIGKRQWVKLHGLLKSVQLGSQIHAQSFFRGCIAGICKQIMVQGKVHMHWS